MDKTAQAARQTRLAQALRTNLRRRKSGDAHKTAQDEATDPADAEAAPALASSEVRSAT